MTAPAEDRYTVVSADCHAGADLLDYKPYLEKRHHEEFDAWASTYVNPYEDLLADTADRNWNSRRRLAELEADGIVAEVLFPNTIPPFFPTASLMAPAPTREEFTLRWAGLRAHNRWLADFCDDAPGRRAGVTQILLNDVDEAVKEIRRTRDAGLTGGILLPGAPRAAASPSCTPPPTTPSGRCATNWRSRSTTTAARPRPRWGTSRRPGRSSWWRPPGSPTAPCGT